MYLAIYDFNHNLIEKEAYWDFSELKEKLECKLKYLAIILAKEQNHNYCDYYNYVELYCYILKDFETFLDLIDKNIISVSMTCSATKYGPSIGKQKMSCYFRIGIFDLPKLFTLDYKVGGSNERYLI